MVISVSAEVPQGLLKQMASDDFKVREQAYLKLKKWSYAKNKTSPELLYKVWQKTEDPEVKTRIYRLMRESLVLRQFGAGKGFVGIEMRGVELPAQPDQKIKMGVRIMEVKPKTPAEKAELKAGDIILRVDKLHFDEIDVIEIPMLQRGTQVQEAFSRYIQSRKPGEEVILKISRNGKILEKKVVLMKWPQWANDPFSDRDQNLEKAKEERFFAQWLEQQKK